MNLLDRPTVEYCEKAIDFIIARPGYALSNLPYIALGIYLLTKSRTSPLAKYFGIFSVVIGTASFIYDSTYTLLSQLIDLMGMFLFINFLLVLAVRRLTAIPLRTLMAVYAVILVLFVLLTAFIGGSSGRILFGTSVLALIILEVVGMVRKGGSMRSFLVALGFFVAGFGIWLFDAQQIWCDPYRIFNGRNIFLYLTTASIWFLYRHYRHFEAELFTPSKREDR